MAKHKLEHQGIQKMGSAVSRVLSSMPDIKFADGPVFRGATTPHPLSAHQT